MKTRSRFLLPLAAALLLGAALAVHFFLSTPEHEPSPVAGNPSVESASTAQAPASAPVAPAAARVKPEAPAQASAQVAETLPATVVPVGPGDHVPETPPDVVSSEPNDPIVPEQPQTAAWKHEKTARITELLDRDVERLVEERRAAESRGDAEEARRLEVQLARHRSRLGKLREEAAGLAESARAESAE